jgi:hypothetical protein
MPEKFPAVGHRYRVDFVSEKFGGFRVELHFISETSLTFAGIRPDGSLGPESPPVTIAVDPVRDGLFLVTWTEEDLTTVVHLEDFKNNIIITHITNPDHSFQIFRGTMTQVS